MRTTTRRLPFYLLAIPVAFSLAAAVAPAVGRPLLAVLVVLAFLLLARGWIGRGARSLTFYAIAATLRALVAGSRPATHLSAGRRSRRHADRSRV